MVSVGSNDKWNRSICNFILTQLIWTRFFLPMFNVAFIYKYIYIIIVIMNACVHARGQNEQNTPANSVRRFDFFPRRVSAFCASSFNSRYILVAYIVSNGKRPTPYFVLLHIHHLNKFPLFWMVNKNWWWKISFAFCTRSMTDFVSVVSCLMPILWMKFHGPWCDANKMYVVHACLLLAAAAAAAAVFSIFTNIFRVSLVSIFIIIRIQHSHTNKYVICDNFGSLGRKLLIELFCWQQSVFNRFSSFTCRKLSIFAKRKKII